ncbi:hypothetical protein [Hafnia alvei]|uniref:Uncharacterized protein n=1 Tax=Hafnia alvei TaxID=569 RepID=A0ABD7Q6D5_HAFAL|nr:hypothetical protein [Hafnia alvei]TBL67828.1 hypothetical protein EYY96_09695 [Hafnia alvei]
MWRYQNFLLLGFDKLLTHYSQEGSVMNAHQLIGEIVHQLIKENSYIDYEIIQDRVVKETMRVSKPGMDRELADACNLAIKIVSGDYKPKI